MVSTDSVHRYPRLLTWSIELFCTLIVLLSSVYLGAVLLRSTWDLFGVDYALAERVPFLRDMVGWISTIADQPRFDEFIALLPAFTWTALALLLAILLRNAFPVVRTSSRGMLVEFGGNWLPIRWEDLHTIKVTSDLSNERFVLLVQPRSKQLTGWHLFYSLFYSLGLRPGFLVTSHISDFEKLVKTTLDESRSVAQAKDNVQPVNFNEEAQSPLFRMLLSPASFVSRRSPGETTTENEEALDAARASGEPVHGIYPARITTLINWGAILLVLLMVWHYIGYWTTFLALEIPALRDVGFFRGALTPVALTDLASYYPERPMPLLGTPGLPNLPAPLWLLVAAHLMVLFVLGVLAVLRNLLPRVEIRPEGLAVRVIGGWIPTQTRWKMIPWKQFAAIKATEFSEESQILLLQTRTAILPASYRVNSLIYDGSFKTGLLVTSAMSNFEYIMQQVLVAVSQLEDLREQEAEARGVRPPDPVLQQEAHSWLLWMTFKPRSAVQDLVDVVCAETNPSQMEIGWLRRAVMPMLWVALLPVLIFLTNGLLLTGHIPGIGLILGLLLLWFIGMLEWPLISLLAILLDDATGGGEEGYRTLYLYPTTQLPRVLPLIVGMVLLAVGWPALAILAWMVAIGMSGWLSANLWDRLYGWKGSQLILGGLMPVVWQLLVLLIYALVQR
jgi:hypothetical protein